MSRTASDLRVTGTCEALVAREFWRDQDLVHHACYVFLQLSGGDAFGWLFDDELQAWQIEPVARVNLAPIEPFTTADGITWSYPLVDLADHYGLRGRKLARWVNCDGPIASARLEFADGSAVVFDYDCRADTDTVRFEPPSVAGLGGTDAG